MDLFKRVRKSWYVHTRRLTLERNGILLHGVNGILGDGSLSIDKDRSNVDLFPLNRNLWRARGISTPSSEHLVESSNLGGGVNVLDRLADFRSNSY